ncbi:molluscan insulin-related peptide 1-like [Montipora capricornis]|uniref:molluscan insulin-related peptide 1-like n=1 Tax=Montipora capricornis TaxID=246305 RepID=UPI0035F1BABD
MFKRMFFRMDQIKTVGNIIFWMLCISPLLLKGQTTTTTMQTTLEENKTTTQLITTTTQAYTGCKVNEVNSPPSINCQKWCGEQILDVYEAACGNQRRRRRVTGILRLSQINLDRREALKFLITSHRPTLARGKRSGTTNIVEECCYEGCVSEEVQEYC